MKSIPLKSCGTMCPYFMPIPGTANRWKCLKSKKEFYGVDSIEWKDNFPEWCELNNFLSAQDFVN